MRTDPRPLALAALLAFQGVALAAPLPAAPAAIDSPTSIGRQPANGGVCGKAGCASCTAQVPTCKPKWEDKKTKKAKFSMTCDLECARPWEPYHQGRCCEEKTTPCGEVRTRKRLYKTEEDRVERVLKYEVAMTPAAPCCEPEPACGCLGCRSFGPAFERLFGWCH